MTNSNIDKLLESCDALQRRTLPSEGCMYSSTRCFNACMRAFDCKCPAESITFNIFFCYPVGKPGYAKIYRDGHMEMWTA